MVAGLAQDIKGKVPEHLMSPRPDRGTFWVDECWCFHTAAWWRNHWARISTVNVEVADVMPDGWKHWVQYENACDEAGTLMFPSEADTLEVDAGRYLALIRMVGHRK